MYTYLYNNFLNTKLYFLTHYQIFCNTTNPLKMIILINKEKKTKQKTLHFSFNNQKKRGSKYKTAIKGVFNN